MWTLVLLAACVQAEKLGALRVTTQHAHEVVYPVARAAFGPHVTSSRRGLQLVHATVSVDCTRIELPSTDGKASHTLAVLLDRGGLCSFVQKTLAAQVAGVSLVVIGDTVRGAAASAEYSGVPVYDCELGQATVRHNASDPATYPLVSPSEDGELCAVSPLCDSGACVYTGITHQGFQTCCFQSFLVQMGADPSSQELVDQVEIPAVFLRYQDAAAIKKLLLSHSVEVVAIDTKGSPWNISMFLTWLLGVAVVIGGAYCSAGEERRFSYEKVAFACVQDNEEGAMESGYVSIDDDDGTVRHPTFPPTDENDEKVELSLRHTLFFVVASSIMLLMLYYGHLVLMLNVLFMLATTASVNQVVILPVLLAALPASYIMTPRRRYAVFFSSILLSFTIALYWFFMRTSPYIWPLQDLLCVSLCFVILDSLQLPSLKVATCLLVVAFFYDIFFVYITPLLFGSSVMIDVAAGGANVRIGGDTLYCKTHPSASGCHHERIPMVLSIPLLSSYYGGNALLGLGDLILPGLLVSFCIRYDYCKAYPLSTNYFALASATYAAGLLLANIMTVVLRDMISGQPALMYIVPLMLGGVLGLAFHRNELSDMWQGPVCLRMALNTHERPPRKDEVEPFLKKS
ncbi:hypothetical protein Poli38472_008422 [Pythium oligandrum]|uniref:PA domain-containing protein n=1 Tax=Pythium oligandrum TaxID=41045 RepID=A0A8K1CND7_PYTOL|nr:hypothetical protein Poli38472_008422 [Pythium oligandrum]|eukprot:TMW65780.1 hypothetical protein Poli38472_008422 [Pythium oligandrum]